MNRNARKRGAILAAGLVVTVLAAVTYAESTTRTYLNRLPSNRASLSADGHFQERDESIIKQVPPLQQPELFHLKTTKLWTENGNTIPTCWATPGYAREKSIITNAVMRTWPAVANLHFTWREGCPTTGSDLYVKIQTGRHTAVGASASGTPIFDHKTDGQTRPEGMETLSAPTTEPLQVQGSPGVTVWVEDNGGSLQPQMEYVAVHEFGHVLGFHHEQDRPEAEARACSLGAPTDAGTTVGPYDPDSIMNYCNADGNANGVLSEGDIANVRAVYGCSAATGTFFADVNGDKRADAIAVNAEGTYVMLSDGTKFTSWNRWSSAFVGTRETLFADVNGDGRADAIAVNNKAVYVMTSDGTHFVNWAQWTNAPFYGARKTVAADVNGDGRADLVAINNNGVFVMTSDGTQFTHWAQWTTGPFYGTRSTYVVDVNGDGKADLTAVGTEGIRVALSDGSHFVDKGIWLTKFFGSVDTTFADVDGDGRADAVAINHDRINVALSGGSSFGRVTPWTSAPFTGTLATAMADVSGDRKSDTIAVNNKGNFVMKSTGSSFVWSGEWSAPFHGGN